MSDYTPRGRRLALLAGLAVTAILAAAGARWREFVVHHHLARLRREPGALLELAGSLRESFEGAAVRRFVKTPSGKRRLLEEYLDAMLAASPGVGETLRRVREDPDVLLGGLAWAGGEAWTLLLHGIPHWRVNRARQEGREALPGELQLLLVEAGCLDHRLPAYPGLSFSVLPSREWLPPGGFQWEMGGEPDHLCVVRREPAVEGGVNVTSGPPGPPAPAPRPRT